MNDKWLESFVAVAECGSITKAAQKRFISPQALLQQINLLEKSIGIKLLHRSNSGVLLTPAGQEFLEGAQRILDLYHTTIDRCQKYASEKRVIRIPLMPSLANSRFVESICLHYAQEYPDQYEVRYIETNYSGEGWLAGLRSMEYDLIQMYTVDGLYPKDIYFETNHSVKTYCVMSPQHPLAKKKKLKLEDLEGCTVAISDEKLTRYAYMYVENTGINVMFKTVSSGRYEFISRCNAGWIVFMADYTTEGFPGLACIPLDFDMHVECGLACRKEMAQVCAPFFQIAQRIRKNKRP